MGGGRPKKKEREIEKADVSKMLVLQLRMLNVYAYIALLVDVCIRLQQFVDHFNVAFL